MSALKLVILIILKSLISRKIIDPYSVLKILVNTKTGIGFFHTDIALLMPFDFSI